MPQVLNDNVEAQARLMTDESGLYKMVGTELNHSEHEYSRGDVTTNAAEGFFGLIKLVLVMKKNSATALTLVQIMRRFPDAETARVYLEKMRWPAGVMCPHCDGKAAYKLTQKAESKRPGRKGLYKCKACRKQFTVTVGTIFEDSHISLDKVWCDLKQHPVNLMCADALLRGAHQVALSLISGITPARLMTARARTWRSSVSRASG